MNNERYNASKQTHDYNIRIQSSHLNHPQSRSELVSEINNDRNRVQDTRIKTENTLTNTESLKVQLIYAKSGFYLKDSNPFRKNNIHGYFTIISKSMKNVDILVLWIPEYLIEANDVPHFINVDGNLATDIGYPTIHLNHIKEPAILLPLADIDSFYLKPPNQQEQHGSIIITTGLGDVLKPLQYLRSSEVLESIETYAWPGYDIIDILTCFHPIQRSYDLPHVYIVENLHKKLVQESYRDDDSTFEDDDNKFTKTVQSSLLERLSKLTQVSIEQQPSTSISLMKNNSVQSIMKQYQLASCYLSLWETSQKSNLLIDHLDELLKDMPELNRPIPTHTRRPHISVKEWASFFDYEGKPVIRKEYIEQLIFQGGIHDKTIRMEAWKFLLKIYPWESTFQERKRIDKEKSNAYFELKSRWFGNLELTNRFENEIDRDLRHYQGQVDLIKDVLITFSMKTGYYIQGMFNVLEPLLVSMKGDESMGFWAFSQFMDRIQTHFSLDQKNMYEQLETLRLLIQFMDHELFNRLKETSADSLIFCFRWFLVWFKHEFQLEDLIYLWQVLWTNYLTHNMVVFVALAIIESHRKIIMETHQQFDRIFKYMSDQNCNLQDILKNAEVLFYKFERKLKAIQRKKSMLEEKKLKMDSTWNYEKLKIQEQIKQLDIPTSLTSLLN